MILYVHFQVHARGDVVADLGFWRERSGFRMRRICRNFALHLALEKSSPAVGPFSVHDFAWRIYGNCNDGLLRPNIFEIVAGCWNAVCTSL